MRFALSAIAGALLAASAVSAGEHQVRHTPRHHALAAREPAPVVEEQAPANATLRKRFTGSRMTYYDVGLGACGSTNVPSDFIVALNSALYDSGNHCGQMVTISYNGKTTQAQIMDRCPGCPPDGLDMSTSLFNFFSDPSAGVIYADWDFGSGSGGGGNTQPTSSSTSETPAYTPPSSTPPPPSSTSVSSSSSTSSSSSSSSSSTTTSSSSTLSVSVSLATNSLVSVSGSGSYATETASNNIQQLYMGIVNLGAIIAAAPTATA